MLKISLVWIYSKKCKYFTFPVFLNSASSDGIISPFNVDFDCSPFCIKKVVVIMGRLDCANSSVVLGSCGSRVTVRDENISPPYKLFIKIKQANVHPSSKRTVGVRMVSKILAQQGWLNSWPPTFNKYRIILFLTFPVSSLKTNCSRTDAVTRIKLQIRQNHVCQWNGENIAAKLPIGDVSLVTMANSKFTESTRY